MSIDTIESNKETNVYQDLLDDAHEGSAVAELIKVMILKIDELTEKVNSL